ncbi:hypothetical protein [Corynebacterium pygosceleis]|uniref:hypothetical protein n=1 Tax=Corynebacterium pygosceleis TaxID=2800406 RepID=UPI00200463BE|nr:hypothetical protein [Corynebacterium pygosceleis]MCK7676349.1 hypothetical protein [Corynebacterium pygosceleis]
MIDTGTIEGLTAQESMFLARMRAVVQSRHRVNTTANNYYEGKFMVKNMNIAVPPTLAQIDTVSDWPGTVVDAHHERLHLAGWKDGGNYGLAGLSAATGLELRFSEAAHDSLVFGVGFIALEPSVQDPGEWSAVSVSPLEGTAIWDVMRDAPIAAYRQIDTSEYAGEAGMSLEVLYLRDRVVLLQSRVGASTVQLSVPHRLDVPPVVRVRNKIRSRRWYGKSLISPPVRYYTDAAVRTLLGMEINREFYTTPQRYALNADMSMFTESDNPTRSEKIKAGWDAIAGRMLAVPPPEEGDPAVDIGQFTAAPPSPYIEQVRCYSQLLASATGIPSAYLGFSSDNPPSGDAIRAWQERLVRSVQAQQKLVGPDLRRLAWMTLTVTDGTSVSWGEFASKVSEKWADPSTPTFASDVDASVKLIQAGAVGAQSDWVYDKIRVPESERAELRAAARASGMKDLAEAIKGRHTPETDQQAMVLAARKGVAE